MKKFYIFSNFRTLFFKINKLLQFKNKKNIQLWVYKAIKANLK